MEYYTESGGNTAMHRASEQSPEFKEISEMEDILSPEQESIVTPFNYDYLKGVKSVTELYRRIFLEHFGNIVPVIHFTNEAVGNDLKTLMDTGFVKRFTAEGTQGKLHVGAVRLQNNERQFKDVRYETDDLRELIQAIRDIGKQFMHHGRRTNKNQLENLRGSKYSQPLAVILDSDQELIRGTDRYYHWILKNPHGAEKIIDLIHFEAGAASKYYEPTEAVQNTFVKKFLHALGKYRLRQIAKMYRDIEDTEEQSLCKEYAQGLFRAKLVTREEYDEAFSKTQDGEKTAIIY